MEGLQEKVDKLEEKVAYHNEFIKVLDGKNSTKLGVED